MTATKRASLCRDQTVCGHEHNTRAAVAGVDTARGRIIQDMSGKSRYANIERKTTTPGVGELRARQVAGFDRGCGATADRRRGGIRAGAERGRRFHAPKKPQIYQPHSACAKRTAWSQRRITDRNDQQVFDREFGRTRRIDVFGEPAISLVRH